MEAARLHRRDNGAMLDPNNSIVKLCVEGMEHEGKGDFAGTAHSFTEAWDQATNDLERCIAAHYIARHQDNHLDALKWNQLALDHANASSEDQLCGFYPSLYLNLGKSHEDLGNIQQARHFYELATGVLDTVLMGPMEVSFTTPSRERESEFVRCSPAFIKPARSFGFTRAPKLPPILPMRSLTVTIAA